MSCACRVLTIALMIQCCVRLSSVFLFVVCNVCIVAKRCILPKTVWKKANRKWPMVSRMVTWPMTSRDRETLSRDPNKLRAQYLENSCICYLAIRFCQWHSNLNWKAVSINSAYCISQNSYGNQNEWCSRSKKVMSPECPQYVVIFRTQSEKYIATKS